MVDLTQLLFQGSSAGGGGTFSTYDPAFGLTLVQNPEKVVANLAARGIEPPANIPDGATHQEAQDSLGKALSSPESASGTEPPQEGSQGGGPNLPSIPNPVGTILPPLSGAIQPSTSGDVNSFAMGGAADTEPPPGTGYGGGSSDAMGASNAPEEGDNVSPKAPTPSPESPNSSGAVPSGNTQTQSSSDFDTIGPGQSSSADQRKKKDDGMGSLGQALAGLKSLAPPSPPVHAAPLAHQGQIHVDTAPLDTMIKLFGSSRAGDQPYRLGQALSGLRGQ